MILKLLLPLTLGGILFAQTPDLPDLKAVLQLSDAQIQSLGQLQQQKAQSVLPIAQQIQRNQQLLDSILNGPSPDPAAVGRVLIEISTLGRQVQKVADNFQQQAASLLQPDQRSKLTTLGQVFVLQRAAQEAVGLGLVNPVPPAQSSAAGPAPQ